MKKSPALQFVSLAWDAIPHTSWQRLNSGMYSALSNAIGSGMKFEPGDIGYIYFHFDASYWIGEKCEGLYASACGGERGDYNLSAAIAFEKHWGRPAWLWAEETKTPKRLHVGAQFLWKGHRVHITSFNDANKSLIACTYKTGQRTTIDSRFTITHEELMAVRAEADALVRGFVKRMKAAETMEQLHAVNAEVARIGAAGFRHFDAETLRAESEKVATAIRKSVDESDRQEYYRQLDASHDADLERWTKGEDIHRHFNTVRLRIKDSYVETSTMQRATVKSARRALMFVNKYREIGWQSNGETHEVDKFPIKSITATEVVVGCTTIPMSEVDRIAPQLRKS